MNNNKSEINNIEPNEFLKKAPKVWGMVVPLLPKEVLHKLQTDPNFKHPIPELFQFLWQSSRLELPSIPRTEGVSFNPRPARLIEILIRENGATTKSLTLLELLEGVLLAVSLDPPTANVRQQGPSTRKTGEPPKASTPDVQIIAELVHAFESDYSCQIPAPKDEILSILLARSLDSLRHGHLDGVSPTFQQSQIQLAERLLGIVGLAESHTRLFTLVAAALNRVKRRLK